jgi:hypothetical protein
MWKAEIGRIAASGQLGPKRKKFMRPLSQQKKVGCGDA